MTKVTGESGRWENAFCNHKIPRLCLMFLCCCVCWQMAENLSSKETLCVSFKTKSVNISAEKCVCGGLKGSKDPAEQRKKEGVWSGLTWEPKPSDLSAPSLCSIFDATACELWMVLIENNSVQQQCRCGAAKSCELITGAFATLPGSEHNNNNKSPASSLCYTSAKRPSEPTDGEFTRSEPRRALWEKYTCSWRLALLLQT